MKTENKAPSKAKTISQILLLMSLGFLKSGMSHVLLLKLM